mmetsp:Transcript_71297/g.206782  ORF Transcript_71297/g.206782 Transcript_71297/m.206782 type:complete len:212 (+) Transcript_71297:142-777(+)
MSMWCGLLLGGLFRFSLAYGAQAKLPMRGSRRRRGRRWRRDGIVPLRLGSGWRCRGRQDAAEAVLAFSAAAGRRQPRAETVNSNRILLRRRRQRNKRFHTIAAVTLWGFGVRQLIIWRCGSCAALRVVWAGAASHRRLLPGRFCRHWKDWQRVLWRCAEGDAQANRRCVCIESHPEGPGSQTQYERVSRKGGADTSDFAASKCAAPFGPFR